MIIRSSPLQMKSHSLRKNLLQELHEEFIRLVNEKCYPLMLEIFQQYKKSIKLQIDINTQLQQIQLSYQAQTRNQLTHENLRKKIFDQIQRVTPKENKAQIQKPTPNKNEVESRNVNTGEQPTKKNHEQVSLIMKTTIEEARNNIDLFNNLITQLQQSKY